MDILIILFISLFGTIIINRLLLVFSKNLGTRGSENIQVRWASTSKPSLGGFAYYIVFVGLVGVTGLLDLEYFIFTKKQLLGIFIAISCGFGIGFTDDTYNTNPRLKAFGQLFCALILYYFDIQIQIFNNQFGDFVFTTFWIMGIMNSINMLDNMDGVTATTSICVILSFIVVSINFNYLDRNILYILVGVTGSLIGFLYHNWHPSKLYMGDAGSQFLGIFLAAFSVPFLWNNNSFNLEIPYFSKFVVPVLVFCIPLIDTATVVYYRLRRKTSPFLGGSDHTTHHLVFFGFSERNVVLFFTIINFIGLIIIYNILINGRPNLFYSLCIILFLFLVFSVIEFLYVKGLKNANKKKKSQVKDRASIYDKLINK